MIYADDKLIAVWNGISYSEATAGSDVDGFSDLGTTWTKAAFTPTNYLNAIAANDTGTAFVAVGGTMKQKNQSGLDILGSPYVVYSTDGETWHTASTPTIFQHSFIYDVAWGDGLIVAVGERGAMGWSHDGATWTTIAKSTFSTAEDIRTVAYGDGIFMMAGDKGKINYYDATAGGAATVFAAQQTDSSIRYDLASYGNGKFLLGGTNTSAWPTTYDIYYGKKK
jgi:hypothetical protein